MCVGQLPSCAVSVRFAPARIQPQRDVTRSLPLNCADGERRDVERVVTFQLVASPNGALFPHEIH